MKVLLINPPIVKTDTNIWKYLDSCTPPFGLAIIGSILEANSIDVQILDCNALKISLSEINKSLPESNWDYIGITATTALILNAIELADICKVNYPNAKIVLGGVHPTIFPEEPLASSSIDFVIRGEGEESFLQLISSGKPSAVSGLSYKKDNAFIHIPRSSKLIELDDLPMPAYHLLPMNKYNTALGSSLRTPGIGMISSRGCPGKCTFCYGNILGARIRFRSPAKIFQEIELLQQKYNIKEIAFYDDTFTASKKNVSELCEILIDNKTDLTWSCFSRVDTVNGELLKLMKKAGCHQVSVGIESGDQEILKNINKKINLDQARKMVKDCQKAGITVRACFMLGNPGETPETIRQTINFSKDLNPDIALYNITTPFPGSKMHIWAKEKGYLKTENWRDYDLAKVIMELPTIESQVLKEFYKKAFREFYLRPSYLLNRLFKIRSFDDVKSNLNAMRAILKI